MNSYVNMILDLLPGDTPKEQYEYVIRLQNEHINLYAKQFKGTVQPSGHLFIITL